MQSTSDSQTFYENNLPDDLLELIDHTTRGVRRLYESTLRRGTSGRSREEKLSSSLRQRGERQTGDPATGGEGAPLSSSLTFERSTRCGGVASAPKNNQPAVRNGGGRNNNHNDRSGDGARRWPWSRVKTSPARGIDDENSAISTANMTLSSDASCSQAEAQKRRNQAHTHGQHQKFVASNHCHSKKSTVDSSTTGADENSFLQHTQGWKDTFKSLLAGAAAAPAPAPVTTSAVATTKTAGLSFVEDNCKEQKAVTRVLQGGQTQESSEITSQSHVYLAKLKRSNALIEDLRRQLEEQEISHTEEVSLLRREHTREISQLRREALEARKKTEDEVTSQLQASFSVKQKLLQAAVENERMQVVEAQNIAEEKSKIIDRLRAELESSLERSHFLEREVDAKEKQLAELRGVLSKTREELALLEEAHVKRAGELAESKKREKATAGREQAALDLVSRLELKLREQDQTSREELRRLEAEFYSTAESYQKLVGEVTTRLSELEKIEGKYRALREQRRQHKQQEEEWSAKLASIEKEKEQLTLRTATVEKEVEDLRLYIARKEHEMREERAAHHQIVENLTKQMEEQGDKAKRSYDSLQKSVTYAEETVARLQREIEGVTRQLEEEQKHSKELLVRLEQNALRHQEDLASARRSASVYQQQSEGVLASLKRLLREKDAKLETLAKATSEPIQRLRSQLEDERSKRANLEEQFSRYKQQARVAKEAALREVRREQQRAPFFVRSNSKTNSKLSSISPQRNTGEELPASGSSHTLNMQVITDTLSPSDQHTRKSMTSRPPNSRDCSKERNEFEPQLSVPSHAGWDSVGSISNISCGSHLCSSRSDVVGCVQNGLTAVGQDSNAPKEPKLTLSPSDQQDNMDKRLAQHERLLHEFHESAAEVFRKITGNRDEFLAKCTSMVRSATHNINDIGGSVADEARNVLP